MVSQFLSVHKQCLCAKLSWNFNPWWIFQKCVRMCGRGNLCISIAWFCSVHWRLNLVTKLSGSSGFLRFGFCPWQDPRCFRCTVIPATPFFAIITQSDHKYATHSPAKQFCVFLATAPTDVLTAGTAENRKTKFMGKVLHICGKTKALHHCRNYWTFEWFLKTYSIDV